MHENGFSNVYLYIYHLLNNLLRRKTSIWTISHGKLFIYLNANGKYVFTKLDDFH